MLDGCPQKMGVPTGFEIVDYPVPYLVALSAFSPSPAALSLPCGSSQLYCPSFSIPSVKFQ